MIIPADFGRLLVDKGEEEATLQSVPYTRPKDTFSMQQQFRILSMAKNHKHFPITIELYLESPLQDPTSESMEMVLIERHTIHLQVSKTYIRTPDAEILLITNPKTNERQSQAVQHFVKNSLRMKMDICNIHQNGGLLGLPENDFDGPYPIMTAYRNGSVLILDDKFEFFDAGERTTSQLCDPQWLHELATNGCSALFLHGKNGDVFKTIARSSVLPLSIKLEDAPTQIQNSHTFSRRDELLTSILQEKQFGNVRAGLSALTLKPPKWYRLGKDRPDKQAKALAKYLRNRLPDERFLISFVSPQQRTYGKGSTLTSDATSGQAHCTASQLIVLTGAHCHRSIVSTESDIALALTENTNAAPSRLDDHSKFNIIASLPFQRRLNLLWKNKSLDEFVTKAITLSMVREVFQEISGVLDSVRLPLPSVKEGDISAAQTFLKTQLSFLAQILDKTEAEKSTPPPKPILEILHWALALVASRKGRRLNNLIRAVMDHRPSTKAFNLHPSSCTAFLKFDLAPTTSSLSLPDRLIQQIAQLTETPEYAFTRGQMCAADVVPLTRSCTPLEWDTIVHSGKRWRERLQADMAGAQKELGRMLVDVSPSPSASASPPSLPPKAIELRSKME